MKYALPKILFALSLCLNAGHALACSPPHVDSTALGAALIKVAEASTLAFGSLTPDSPRLVGSELVQLDYTFGATVCPEELIATARILVTFTRPHWIATERRMGEATCKVNLQVKRSARLGGGSDRYAVAQIEQEVCVKN